MKKTGRGVKTLITKNGKILLLREPNGVFDLPGGRVEDEEGFEAGARREIKEETGLKVRILGRAVEWSFWKNRSLRIMGITYYCQYLSGEVRLSDEHSDYSWVGIAEIGQIHWDRPYLGPDNSALTKLPELPEMSC